jgi:SAM-dependent methyltransferase
VTEHTWKLDVGCGRGRRDGFVGIDFCPGAVADILANPEKGLPFKDDVFEEVWMNHVFEHLLDPVRSMEEIWRVCRDGARVEIRGPHFSAPHLLWGDPTHRRGLSLGTFRYFEGGWHGTKAQYRIERCILVRGNTRFRDRGWRFWYWPFVIPNRIIESVVNLSLGWISRYERFASRFLSFEEIRIVLSVRKGS